MTDLSRYLGVGYREPEVRLVRLTDNEYETEDEEMGYCSGGGRSRISGGERGAFSDDTGFYSAESQEEIEEDGGMEGVEQRVRMEYPKLLSGYIGVDPGRIGDPFLEVNFGEMCVVLGLSGERSGLVVAAQLLDVMLQIFAKQVKLAQVSVVQIVNEIHRQNRLGRRSEKKDRQLQNGQQNAPDADEGYGSQPLSQSDGMDVDDEDQGKTPRRLSLPSRTAFKSVANKDQLDNDFVKERSANIVSRRKNLHDHCLQTVQEPYLDYIFNIQEYYQAGEEIGGLNEMKSLDSTATNFLQDLKRLTSKNWMGWLPPFHLEDEVDTDLPIDFPEGEEEANENLEPSPEDMPPSTLGGLLDDLVIMPVTVEIMEGDGENVPPPVPQKEKKKKKRKRQPFLEQQNIGDDRVVPCEGDELAAKRPRLDEDLLEPEQLLQNDSNQSLLMDDNGLDHFMLTASDRMEISGDLENYFNYASFDENFELTDAANSDLGSFRPPSRLATTDKSSLNFTKTNSNPVNMSAIKANFNRIVHEATLESQISFVEILQKSQLDILVGSDQVIPSSPQKGPAQEPSSSAPVSVGVAFLAMLHNASHGNFHLVEDPDGGAFKVSKDPPEDNQDYLNDTV